MGFITAGYDGTVDEVQLAKLLYRYSVVGAQDFKATTQAGDRIVAISDGTALGPGTVDVATAIPPIQFAAAAAGTTRWDLVALRRDWQPPGGASSITIIQGGSSKGFPSVGTATTAWNRRPGIMDDQPLYLQEINGTLLGARIDLRVWNGGSGLYAKDDLVRSYMDAVGTVINISGVDWARVLGDNDAPTWQRVPPVHVELTTGANTAAPNIIWGLGSFSVDNTKSDDTALAVPNGTDLIKVRDAGLYSITVLVSFTKPISGVSWLSVDGNYTVTMGGGLQNFAATLPNVKLTAGQVLNPTLAHGSGPDENGISNRTFTSRVRITRIA